MEARRRGFAIRLRSACLAGSSVSVLSVLLLWIAIAGARGALPPYVYEEARRNAPYHLQVAISDVAPPAETPGYCRVTGKIVTLFRDRTGKFALGQTIEFLLACMRKSDEPLIGGTIYTYLDSLAQAKYIEAYLTEQDRRLEVARSQSLIIEAPSSAPLLPVVQGHRSE